jgi:hypothetical protein
MTGKSLVLALGAACLLGGAAYFMFQQKGDKGDGWKEYEYPNDGYAVSTPSNPIPFPPSEEDPDNRSYRINYGENTMVAFGASPYAMWGDLSPKAKLERIEEMEVKGTAGKLVSEKEISLAGNPGIELEVEFHDSHMHSRWYVVNGKVLYLYSVAPTDAPLAGDTGRIFDSLRLLR